MKRSFPEHWVVTTLGSVSEIVTGNTPRKNNPEFYGDKYPWIKPDELDKEEYVCYSKEMLSTLGAKQARIVPKNSVLVSCIGNLGKIAIAGRELATNQQINSIIFNKHVVNYKFGFYYIKTIKDLLYQKASATTLPIINKCKLSKIEVPLPPLNEQKRIAEKLDTILPKVKSARARLEKIPAILKKFRQSVLAAACSGRLTEDWREEYTERTGKELPEWEEKKLNEIIYNIKYGYTSKSFSHGEIKYLRITDIQNGKVSWETVPFCQIEKNVIKKYLLEKNDIVFARTGATTGKSFLIKDCPPSVFASYLIRIKPNTNIVSAEYLYFFFQTEYYWLQINENVAGIAQPNCNAQKLSNILIPLPPLEEQHEIVRRVEKLFALADSIEEKYKKAYERLEKLEQAILARAFRGELVEPDPNDEPAEELLKRILEEKAKLEREQKGKKRKK